MATKENAYSSLKKEPMNRHYFKTLNQNQQVRLLKIHGRILHRRLKGKYKIYLYEFKNFYIEVWYDEMKNSFDDFVTFKDRVLLNYEFNMVSDQGDMPN